MIRRLIDSRACIHALLGVTFLVLLQTGPAYALLVNEPMTGASAPNWIFGGNPNSAILTGTGAIDPVGDGWLRLTNNTGNQTGFAYYDVPFDLSQGAIIQFDYATWGGTGADGYSIFLFDAAATSFNVGAFGGSLGYAQKTGIPGLSGGYVGIGVDEYGNFANGQEGRCPTNGNGLSPNTVTIRGPMRTGSDQITCPNYDWIATSPNSGSLWSNQGTRPSQTGPDYRKVMIRISPSPNPTISVWIQFGYNQPLTQMLSNVPIGANPPPLVKVGYAASTGGATNYHEIRNLTIDTIGSDVDLAIAKSAPAAVSSGSTITYTVTARNYGPGAVNGAQIVDTVPAEVTGVTWTCAASGGATCGASSGSGNNLATTAYLPLNGAATYTVTGTVSAVPAGGSLVNTATISPPTGVADFWSGNNSATTTTAVTTSVSGVVYNDANHNGTQDAGENGTGLTLYAKLVPAGTTSAIQAVAVDTGTGTGSGGYTFPNVPPGTYIVVLDNNSTLTDITPTMPNTRWTYTNPANFTATVTVGSSPASAVNFGLYYGTRFDGRVFKDDGTGGGTANDAIQNGGETGIAGVTLRLTRNSGTLYDTTVTDANGNYTLYISASYSNRTLVITETNPAGFISTGGSPGTAGGTYDRTTDTVTFGYVRGVNNSGITFADVPPNSFAPNGATIGMAGTSVDYPGTFTPGSGGSVTFTRTDTATPAAPAWTSVIYRDANCNGVLDPGELTAGPIDGSAITTSAGTPVCTVVRESIPPGAINTAQDIVTVTAIFAYTGASPSLSASATLTDTTTVATPLTLVMTADRASSPPGGTVNYTITYSNTNPVTLFNNIVISNPTPAYAAFSSAACGPQPAGITGCAVTTQPPAGGTGPIVWTLTGNLTPGSSGTVTFAVTVR